MPMSPCYLMIPKRRLIYCEFTSARQTHTCAPNVDKTPARCVYLAIMVQLWTRSTHDSKTKNTPDIGTQTAQPLRFWLHRSYMQNLWSNLPVLGSNRRGTLRFPVQQQERVPNHSITSCLQNLVRAGAAQQLYRLNTTGGVLLHTSMNWQPASFRVRSIWVITVKPSLLAWVGSTLYFPLQLVIRVQIKWGIS